MSLASAIFDPYNEPGPFCKAFKRFQIVNHPLGGTLIAWDMQETFFAKGPLHFFIDFGRAGTDHWETLNQTPVVDGCVYMDSEQRYWDHLVSFYYRIRLVLPNEIDPLTGTCKVYVSQPWIGNGVWSKRDWLIAREICRKEYLLQKKRTNLTAVGYLLKRKRFGVRCNHCIDRNTDEVVNPMCLHSYGTKFLGGYYPAIPFTVTAAAPWKREFKRDGQVSMRNDIIRQTRAVAYPFLDTGDIYVRRDSGERFYIHSIEQIAEVGGIPIVVSPELRLAPDTDIAYKVPLEGTPSSSSSSSDSSSSGSSGSSSTPEECGPRAGVSQRPQW